MAKTLTELLAEAEKRLTEETEYAEAHDDWHDVTYWQGYRDAVRRCIKSVDMNGEDD